MPTKYAAWMQAHYDLKMRIGSGELAELEKKVKALQASAAEVEAEDRGAAEVCRIVGLFAEVELRTIQRKYAIADALLDRIQPRLALPPDKVDFLRSNELVARGNLALAQDAIEVARDHCEAAAAAAPEGQPFVCANALFNAGNCYLTLSSETDDDSVLGTAKTRFETASALYAAMGMPSKVADCLHQLGNVARFSGDPRAAMGYHLRAAAIYRDLGDMRGAWYATDDASRAILLHALQQTDECERARWLQQARDISIVATFAAQQVWDSALDNEGVLQLLAIEQETHLVNRIDIAVSEEATLALVHMALIDHKGKTRSTQPLDVSRLATMAARSDSQAAILEGVRPAFADIVTPSVEALKEAGSTIAIIDQFCLRGRDLIHALYVFGDNEGRDVTASRLPDSVPNRPDADEPRLRGGGRANPAAPIIERFRTEILRGGDRALALLGASPRPRTAEEVAQLADWSRELDDDARLLGSWFFPDELLEVLDEANVDHVVLIPDPHYLDVPYLALLTARGRVIDQRWTLSVSAALIDLGHAAAQRVCRLEHAREVVWFGPSDEVNEQRGGHDERARIEKVLQVRAVDGPSATVEGALDELRSGAWLHFRGHGRWNGPVSARGPVCYDGPLTVRAIAGASGDAPSVLVTIACGTAFASAVGTESLGPIAELGNSSVTSALLTLWPVAGDVAALFSEALYKELARGGSLARATKNAALEIKSLLVHPFHWAPFLLSGAWAQTISGRATTCP